MVYSKKIFLNTGTFDPPTLGHLDIISRASEMCDELYVAVLYNPEKKNSMFGSEERVRLLEESTEHLENVKVLSYAGLTADLVKEIGACAIVRGIRSFKDYDYECPMAELNRKLSGGVDTLFLQAKAELQHISSSAVKELMNYGADYSDMVPENVLKACIEKRQ